jgi:hypothetical protein
VNWSTVYQSLALLALDALIGCEEWRLTSWSRPFGHADFVRVIRDGIDSSSLARRSKPSAISSSDKRPGLLDDSVCANRRHVAAFCQK